MSTHEHTLIRFISTADPWGGDTTSRNEFKPPGDVILSKLTSNGVIGCLEMWHLLKQEVPQSPTLLSRWGAVHGTRRSRRSIWAPDSPVLTGRPPQGVNVSSLSISSISPSQRSRRRCRRPPPPTRGGGGNSISVRFPALQPAGNDGSTLIKVRS